MGQALNTTLMIMRATHMNNCSGPRDDMHLGAQNARLQDGIKHDATKQSSLNAPHAARMWSGHGGRISFPNELWRIDKLQAGAMMACAGWGPQSLCRLGP
jgi:hypothetical protein